MPIAISAGDRAVVEEHGEPRPGQRVRRAVPTLAGARCRTSSARLSFLRFQSSPFRRRRSPVRPQNSLKLSAASRT